MIRPGVRFLICSGPLLAPAFPLTKALHRRYGRAESRKFFAGIAGTITLQQALVARALFHHPARRHRLTPIDVITLSRGCASGVLTGLAVSGIRDRRGTAGWLGWIALLYGAILCDWLDGPIARHLGTSDLGTIFDLEGDSWLTLCSAGAATAWGGLPRAIMAAPLLRYALLFEALRQAPYRALHGDEPGWVRHMGIAQMLVFIAGLAPFGGRATRLAVGIVAPLQAPLQVAGLLLLHTRRKRPS